MVETITLVAAARMAGEEGLPAGYGWRRCDAGEEAALGALYFAAYEPGVACATEAEAVADVRASFGGEYGELWPAGSWVVAHGGEPVAAIFTVWRAPWPDVPACPFVIELFTAREQRRRGLARALVARALAAAEAAGEAGLGLRVDGENGAARALYRSLGFVTWRPGEAVGEVGRKGAGGG